MKVCAVCCSHRMNFPGTKNWSHCVSLFHPITCTSRLPFNLWWFALLPFLLLVMQLWWGTRWMLHRKCDGKVRPLSVWKCDEKSKNGHQPLMLPAVCFSLMLSCCRSVFRLFDPRVSTESAERREKKGKNMMFLPVIRAHDVSWAQSGWWVVEDKQHTACTLPQLLRFCFTRSKIIPPQNPLPSCPSLSFPIIQWSISVESDFPETNARLSSSNQSISLIPSSSRGLPSDRFHLSWLSSSRSLCVFRIISSSSWSPAVRSSCSA